MSNPKNILDYFPEYYFWDTDPIRLDVELHAPYIIEKVLQGVSTKEDFDKEIQNLERLYYKPFILSTVEDSTELSRESDIQMWVGQRYNP